MSTQTLTRDAGLSDTSPEVTADPWSDGPKLLVRAVDGDRQAWDGLVRLYTPTLRRLALRYRIGEDVEDAVQTTFVRLVEHAARIRTPEAVGAWLRATLVNECLRILRRRTRERTNCDELVDANDGALSSEPSPEREAVRRLEVLMVRRAVAALPVRDRELMSLLNDPEVDGYRAISEQMGMPIGSIGPTRGRILLRLRQGLQAAGLEDCA